MMSSLAVMIKEGEIQIHIRNPVLDKGNNKLLGISETVSSFLKFLRNIIGGVLHIKQIYCMNQ